MAANPPFGAVFTYYLKDEIKTLKKKRQDEEKKLTEKGGDVRYPAVGAPRAGRRPRRSPRSCSRSATRPAAWCAV